jgi:hypothetical protein
MGFLVELARNGTMILRLLEAFPDAARTAEVAESDWGEAVRSANLHGVAAYLNHLLGANDAQPPTEAKAALDAAVREATLLSARNRSTLEQALNALEQREIRAVALKGWALAERIYPKAELRLTSDVDLLVSLASGSAAFGALENAGGRAAETTASREFYRDHHHHQAPVVGFGSTAVEIHHRALTGYGAELPAEPLLERAHQEKVGGLSLWVLEPEDEFLYLAAHAAGHLFARLGWLLDLKLFLARYSVKWDVVRSRAVEHGFDSALALAETLLRRIGVAVPPGTARLPGQWLGRIEWPFESGWYGDHPRWGAVVCTALASSPSRAARYLAFNASRVARRRIARRLPGLVPASWSG